MRHFKAFVRAFALFSRDRRGGVALAFSLLALPMIVLAGGGVDYARARSSHAMLQGVADAAAMAAGREANMGRAASSQMAAANAIIDSHCGAAACGPALQRRIELGETITVRLDMAMPTAFLGLISLNELGVSAHAQVEVFAPKIRVYFALDFSASMNIPFGAAAIGQLNDAFRPMIGGGGCSFACHDRLGTDENGNPWQDEPRTGKEIADASGILLREDIVKARTGEIIDVLRTSYPGEVEVAVAVFGNNLNPFFQRRVDLSDDLMAARRDVGTLPTGSGGTGLEGATAELRHWIAETSNDPGTTNLAVLLTDGMNDDIVPIDPAFCEPIKDAGTELFVMNIVYPDPSLLEGNAPQILKVHEIYDDLPPALRGCASSGAHYFEAEFGQHFERGFDDLAKRLEAFTKLYLAK